MEMPKKRKRDIAEVDHPRITYDAGTRTFDRLFKEDNLEEMKEVVRKKLGVSDSIPIFLSQIRDGRSVDLEDDDDVEAFRVAAYNSPVVCVKVVLGDHSTVSEPAKNGNSTPISSSKRRKKKKLDITATSSTTNIDELSAPLQKKPRVSFAEPSAEQLIEQPKNSFEPQESSLKRKAKVAVAESPAQSFHHSLADAINTALNGVGSTSESAEAGAPEVKEKKREAAVAGGKKRPRLVNNTTQSATGAAATAATTTPEMPAATRPKKRPRSDVAIEDQPPESSTFPNSASTSKEVDAPQPKKTSRKKQKETVDDSGPTKSRSKSVSPSSIAQAPTMETPATSAPIDVQAKVLPAKTKKTPKKKGDRDIYEPLSASLARVLTPEPVEPAAPEEIETSQIKKIKKNVKPTAVGNLPSGGPSGTKTVASNVKGKKQAISNEKHLDDTSVVPATETTTAMKAKKRPGKAKANVTASDPQEIQTLPSDVHTDKQNTSSAAIEAEAPKRKGRKNEAAENPPESGTKLDPGKSQGDDDTSQEPTNREDLRAATLAAVYTVLTRKGITTTAKSSIASVASPSSTNPPTVMEKGSPEALSVCSICNESPNHGRTVCPVIKGGVRAMRKRVAQLERDPSGNEEVIAELQAIILKRSRKPRTMNAVVSTNTRKAANGAQKGQSDASAAVVKLAEPAKQVDVVSSARVVDAVPPAPPPQPLQSTLPTVRQPQLSLSQPLLRRSQPSSSSQKVMEKAPIEKVMTPFNNANVLNPKNLSRFTDKELENLIYGPKMSIDDVQSSNEEEEEEREDIVSDEDEEPNNRRISQKPSQANYPSSSEMEDEDEDSGTGSGSAPSQPSIAMDNQPNVTGTLEDPLLALGGTTSFREVDTRGSSRELDRSVNEAVDDALAGDLSSFHVALRSEHDSDTVVASQSEEFAGRPLTKTVENVAADAPSLDLIEPSEPPEGGHMEADHIEPIASDDGGPAFPKLKLAIRRSQRNKDKSDDLEEVPATQEDTQIVEGRKSSRTKFMKKITALPVPPNPSVRGIKPRTAMPHVQNTVGVGGEMQENVADEEEDSEPLRGSAKRAKSAPKSLAKNAKTTAKPASKAATSKGKKTPARATRSQATVTPKPRRSVKITLLEPILNDETGGRTMSEVIDDSTVTSSQWAVLPESEPSQVMETPGQIDELLSDHVPDSQVADKGSSQRAMVNGSSPSRDPLFLPSETQESFSYSQHPSVIFGSQRGTQKLSPHDSEDEEEVLASVTKVKTRYRRLSQIASSQSFSTPKFQYGNVKVPELDLYGNRNRSEESESDSMSGSEDEPHDTHIPTSRRAGLQRK